MAMNFAQFAQMHHFDPTGYDRLRRMSPVPQGGYDPHGGVPIPHDPRGGVSAGGNLPADPRGGSGAPGGLPSDPRNGMPADNRTGGGMMTPNQYAGNGQRYQALDMAHPSAAPFHFAASSQWGNSPLLQAIVGLLAGPQQGSFMGNGHG